MRAFRKLFATVSQLANWMKKNAPWLGCSMVPAVVAHIQLALWFFLWFDLRFALPAIGGA